MDKKYVAELNSEVRAMNLGGEYLPDDILRNAGFRKLGVNVKIHSRASLYGIENISLGNNVRIDDFSVVIATGNLEIGNYIQVANFCLIVAKYGVILEDFCTLAPGVKIFTASDDYSGQYLTNPTVPSNYTGGRTGAVVLRKHVIVGTNTAILPDCIIGEGVSIGALSLVKQSLEPWGVYGGVPARRIGDRRQRVLALEQDLIRSPSK